MKITFILPGNSISGGLIAVLHYATEFSKAGHEVNLIWPRSPGEFRSGLRRFVDISRYLRSLVRGTEVGDIDFLDAEANLLEVPQISSRYVPSNDVIIATSWRTAEWVERLAPSKGRKYYFLQHYETWDGPTERVDATWKMPLKKIVVSSWLKAIAEDRFKEEVAGPLIYGVDTEEFFPLETMRSEPMTVGMLYHVADWKGTADGLRAIELVQQKHPDLKLIMFGAYEPQPDELPAYATMHYRPTRSSLHQLYNQCDVWLCPSWHEGGPPIPSQEAAACKCTIVTTDVGAARDCFVNGESALIVPPRDIQGMADSLLEVLSNRDLAAHLAQEAHRSVSARTWDIAAAEFLGYIAP